jgi:hypothetical protein
MGQHAPYLCSRHKKMDHDYPECVAEARAAAPVAKLELAEAPRAGVKHCLTPGLAGQRGRGVGRTFTKATGRAAGLRGGTARAKSLAPEQRQDIARRGASARWGGKVGS